MTDTSMLTEAYRPYTLNDMVGQESAKKVIGAWIRTGRVPRTILITGERSSGKTTSARIIGRSVLCKEPVNGACCGKCASCKAVDSETHPDFIEADAAKERGIDAMRELAQRMAMMPLFGKRKVLVLDECHAITKPAFQALLKTLEEPPAHVVVMLVTTNPELLPPTITSRCSKLQLASVSVEECTELLLKIATEKGLPEKGITEKHLKKISMVTGAHPREALHALDQVYTMVLDADDSGTSVDASLVNSFIAQVAVSDVESAALAITRGILDGKIGGAMKRADDMQSQADFLLTKICVFMQQALRFTVNSKLMDPYYKEHLADLAILGLPGARKAVLAACKELKDLRIACSNHSVPVGEVLVVTVASAGMTCHEFIKSQPPPTEKDESQAEKPKKTAISDDEQPAVTKAKPSTKPRFPD